jgi:hypothetical protein
MRPHDLVATLVTLVVSGALTTGCEGAADAPESITPATPPEAPRTEYLTPTEHLARASMVLQGKRPSLAELRQVRDDPSTLPAIVDGYLASPGFGETTRDLHDEALLVRTDVANYPAGFPSRPPLSSYDSARINRSILEAPLRLIEYVVTHDLPYTEIVTGDYTVADGVVAKVWTGLEGGGDGDEWKLARYTDGRDHAGILADDWLFSRHTSTLSNANRGRAAAMSRALLCTDFLAREIKVDTSIDLGDPDVVANAVVKNAACAGCHQTLDPLASYFTRFYPISVPAGIPSYPTTHYGQNVFAVSGVKMREPSFFGQKLGTGKLRDLGVLISEDPRFSLCAAKRFYAYFNHVPLDDVPIEAAGRLQGVFLDSGMSAKALAKAVVLDDAFRTASVPDEDEKHPLAGLKKARPSELARMFEDLAALKWETEVASFGRVDLARDSFLGFRVLAGGIDSYFVTKTLRTFNATASLVLQQMAVESAARVVDADLATPAPARRVLLQTVTATETNEAAIRDELATLHLRLFAEVAEPSSEEVTATYALFRDALELTSDVREAWKTTLTAMLQDARIAYY